MKKKLIKIGNSLGIILPPNLLELMGVNVKKDSEVDLSFDGKAITIKPVNDKE